MATGQRIHVPPLERDSTDSSSSISCDGFLSASRRRMMEQQQAKDALRCPAATRPGAVSVQGSPDGKSRVDLKNLKSQVSKLSVVDGKRIQWADPTHTLRAIPILTKREKQRLFYDSRDIVSFRKDNKDPSKYSSKKQYREIKAKRRAVVQMVLEEIERQVIEEGHLDDEAVATLYQMCSRYDRDVAYDVAQKDAAYAHLVLSHFKYSLLEHNGNLWDVSNLSMATRDEREKRYFKPKPQEETLYPTGEIRKETGVVPSNPTQVSSSTLSSTSSLKQLRKEIKEDQQKAITSGNYKIEIQPGHWVAMRGAEETKRALLEGRIASVSCMTCTSQGYVIDDAEFMICAVCKCISRNCNEGEKLKYGAGLGFQTYTEEDLLCQK
mmetsp:Transcript_24051/g.33792  ORF Transcript_24051/g.33792 Transcript_24051/m.33792 type:complete len:381 (+) Transcript_24051:101-1243(+)